MGPLVLRYGIAILLSAFLLFQVQPLIAHYILPWFGGGAGVWTSCLLFFQLVLLGGYAYAHALARLATRRQAMVHLALLLTSLLLLPITPSEGGKPVGADDPLARILLLLLASVGGPYFLLSTTSPLLQHWFVRESGGASPYRLYAWSNAASLAGLLAYPFLVQPALDLGAQTRAWSAGYAAFVAAGAICAAGVLRRGEPAAAGAREAPTVGAAVAAGGGAAWLWLLLPACASVLLLGVTNQLTSEVAAVPFLWVLPLALYLVSFIVSFEKPAWYRRRTFAPLFVVALLANTVLVPLVLEPSWTFHLLAASLTVFACGMVCHGELYRLRPDPRRLTSFYLTVAAGGALGGGLVAVAAPLLFPGYWEVPLGLVACMLLLLVAVHRDPASSLHRGRRPGAWSWIAVAVGVLVPGVLGVAILDLREGETQARTFYGVLHVGVRDPGTPTATRVLRHGGTVHGAQFLAAESRGRGTTYYGPGSGAEIAIARHPRRRAREPLAIGAIGLGAGTIAVYGRPGDRLRFYELDPMVERFARRYFTFLADTPAAVEVVHGDGRIALARERATRGPEFDVLVADAFTGGSIPVHLLTRECFALYARALKPGGVLAVHVSNRHLDLAPVVRAAAAALGHEALRIRSLADSLGGTVESDWVLVSADRAALAEWAEAETAAAWIAGDEPRPWTDRRSSLLEVLRRTPTRWRRRAWGPGPRRRPRAVGIGAAA